MTTKHHIDAIYYNSAIPTTTKKYIEFFRHAMSDIENRFIIPAFEAGEAMPTEIENLYNNLREITTTILVPRFDAKKYTIPESYRAKLLPLEDNVRNLVSKVYENDMIEFMAMAYFNGDITREEIDEKREFMADPLLESYLFHLVMSVDEFDREITTLTTIEPAEIISLEDTTPATLAAIEPAEIISLEDTTPATLTTIEPAEIISLEDTTLATLATIEPAEIISIEDTTPATAETIPEENPEEKPEEKPEATPRATVPEKTWINTCIVGTSYTILFDGTTERIRIIFPETPDTTTLHLLDELGFYYRRDMNSYVAGLKWKKYRAALAFHEAMQKAATVNA